MICIRNNISSTKPINPTHQAEPGQSNFYHLIERMPTTKQMRSPSREIGLLYLNYLLWCPNHFDWWTRALLRRGTNATAKDGWSIPNYEKRRTFGSQYIMGVEIDRAAPDSRIDSADAKHSEMQHREPLYSQYKCVVVTVSLPFAPLMRKLLFIMRRRIARLRLRRRRYRRLTTNATSPTTRIAQNDILRIEIYREERDRFICQNVRLM